MYPNEKAELVALLEDPGKWCRNAEARDADGDAVRCNDAAAVAWDITGAMYRLFGWARACVLFGQMDRHIHGRRRALGRLRRNEDLCAMAALQDFNDRFDTTFAALRERIETMPVWRADCHGGCSRQER